jgi:hypothetical protein
LFMVVVSSLTTGCNHEPKLRTGWATVAGTISYQGKPLPGGEVMWCTKQDGAMILRGGSIREDGTFKLDAPTGPAKVAIHTADLKKANSARYVELPAKYADPETSGLTYQVKPGENQGVDFDIQ